MRMEWGKMTKFVMLLACVSLFWMPGFKSACAQMIFQEYTKPQIAPDFSVMDLQGKPVDTAGYRGQVVFLNFWATW
jgi:hypothetical protein